MKKIETVILKENSNEEILPAYSVKFPIISSYVNLNKYPEKGAPWHWHDTLELFYVEKGMIEYFTPEGTKIFSAGTGGIINSNVLHSTRILSSAEENIQCIHLFDATLISGEHGSLIEEKYVNPFLCNSKIEMLAFTPDNAVESEILKLLKESFVLDEAERGYELLLKNKLSTIWLMILDMLGEKLVPDSVQNKKSQQMKQMMIYVQEHYSEKITIKQLANVAYLSERACYRVFEECIRMTPMDYVISYRLQMAIQMLLKEEYSLAEISQNCGFGNSSYLGKVFKERIGCTPMEYRRNWQDNTI